MSLSGRTHENLSFHTTQWSMVLSAGGPTTDSSQQALAQLCERYYYPVYAYIRKRGNGPKDTEDFTQAFFVKLLSSSSLAQADPERGRFRYFLMTAVKNFLHSEYRKRSAQKRGGGLQHLSLDYTAAESQYGASDLAHETDDPESLYLREWGRTLIDNVIRQIRIEQSNPQKVALVERLLESHLWDDSDAVPYPELAKQFETSVSNVKVTAFRLRARFRDLLRDEVAATLVDDSEFDDEWQFLMGLFTK